MKFKLAPTENSRTFYTNKGTQTIIRDTFTPQFDPPQQEPIKEIKSKIADKIIEEVIEKNILIKNIKNKNERPTKN